MNRRLSDLALVSFRLYLGGNAGIVWWNAMTDPRTLMYQVAETPSGSPLIWAMGLVGAMIVADVVINDLMPERYRWCKAIQHRHFLFTALAFCYIAQLYVGVMQQHIAALLAYYLWNAGFILLTSFMDAKKRQRDAQCAMT